MRSLISTWLLALCAGLLLVAVEPRAVQADGYTTQKVVYHINYAGGGDGKAYTGALRNIQNHINAVGTDKLEVRVVLHGDGVYLLRDATNDLTLQGNVADLKNQGVMFNVCANTLRGRSIDADTQLYDVWDSDIVPSGVAELSKLQQDGFTYIKP